MQKSTTEPFMPADEYGRSLKGFGVNLLVVSVEDARAFHREVLGAEEVYHDPDFAVYRASGAEWMLHADHTYSDHPLKGSLGPDIPRGIGVELRLHGRDPDAAEAKARELGYTVLAGAMDKVHGLREAYIVDADGYLWVPDVPIGD
jgi:catechol 2,3-dioxygenase-like lactoylglutathione lyase family enzyme